MKYMGSKNRISKYILPTILKHRKEGMVWVEPFVGGANMIDKVDGERIGADINPYLIAFWQALQNGWTPPENINKQLYDSVRTDKESYPAELVGCIGFCFTYSAKWFGGFIGNTKDVVCKGRDRIGESYRAVEKARESSKGVKFIHSSYQDLEIPPNSLIYCDPPYKGTTKYSSVICHDTFWEWCRQKTKEGHVVFVSEYNAPDDFECVWEKEIVSSLTKNTKTKKGVERLFIHKSIKNKNY